MHSGRRKRAGAPGERVVITGASGLIGKRVAQILVEGGSRVIALARNVGKAQQQLGDQVSCVHWDFTQPDPGALKRCLSEADAVIHLAGTPLFKKRWTEAFKQEMEQSRTLGTRQLVEAIIASEQKPRVFISASALGYYGTNPDGVVDESASPADDLLARICVNWENEARKLDAHGVRTIQMRIGIVLSAESGALKELLPLFRMGLGGTMGDPRPHINWVHIEDMARIFAMALKNEKMCGAYNAVAPNPVSNRNFAKAIARALNRPALLRLPVPVLRIILGEAGQYVSGGPQVRGAKIQDSGYRFFFSHVDQALSNLLS